MDIIWIGLILPKRGLVLSQLQPDLRRKANQILSGYGGPEGLAWKPAWLIGEVLSAFFTDEERREILRLSVFRGAEKEILRMRKSKAIA